MRILIGAFCLLLAVPVLAETIAVRAGTVIDPAHGTSAKG